MTDTSQTNQNVSKENPMGLTWDEISSFGPNHYLFWEMSQFSEHSDPYNLVSRAKMVEEFKASLVSVFMMYSGIGC